jgi:hypothetical protein
VITVGSTIHRWAPVGYRSGTDNPNQEGKEVAAADEPVCEHRSGAWQRIQSWQLLKPKLAAAQSLLCIEAMAGCSSELYDSRINMAYEGWHDLSLHFSGPLPTLSTPQRRANRRGTASAAAHYHYLFIAPSIEL